MLMLMVMATVATLDRQQTPASCQQGPSLGPRAKLRRLRSKRRLFQLLEAKDTHPYAPNICRHSFLSCHYNAQMSVQRDNGNLFFKDIYPLPRPTPHLYGSGLGTGWVSSHWFRGVDDEILEVAGIWPVRVSWLVGGPHPCSIMRCSHSRQMLAASQLFTWDVTTARRHKAVPMCLSLFPSSSQATSSPLPAACQPHAHTMTSHNQGRVKIVK